MQKSLFIGITLCFAIASLGSSMAQVRTISAQAPSANVALPLDPNAGVVTPQAAPTASSSVAAANAPIVAPRVVHGTKSPASAPVALSPDYPKVLEIPSINLSDSVIEVGLTSGGAMAVPSGRTSQVGWYKYGTVPGHAGNAVIDAHVFAAFSNLHRLAPGDTISVVTVSGKSLRFVVTAVESYALADVPAAAVFGATDGAHLNLITCAGNLTADHSTYDHRLIVYASLVG